MPINPPVKELRFNSSLFIREYSLSPDQTFTKRSALSRYLLVICFAVSGGASLMDQVVWLRYLSLSFGNTTYAAATLLAVFMAGLGIGAILFGRLADRLRKPLVVYAVVQIGVALAAALTPMAFKMLDAGYISLYGSFENHALGFAIGRVLLASLVLFPPTLLMGGTLPLILRVVILDSHKVGGQTAVFYAVNTLGAVLGVAFAGFITIRLHGLYSTLLIAAGLDLLAGLGALLLASRFEMEPVEKPIVTRSGPDSWSARRLLALIFLMGATSLAYEVLWTRALVFYLGSSVYAYSLMLLLFLLGVGIGSLAVVSFADRFKSILIVLAVAEVGIALWAVFQIYLFDNLNDLLFWLATTLQIETYSGMVTAQALALFPIIIPPTIAMGISFPLAVKLVNRSIGRLGADTGVMYAANTLGSVVGSLATGFLLIPWLGTQGSLVAVGALNAALAGAFWMQRSPRSGLPRSRWSWVAALAFPVLVVSTGQLYEPDRVILAAGMFRWDASGSMVHFEETAHGSVTVRKLPSREGPYLSLEINGVNVAGTSPDLFAVQKMQGHLPLLLANRARDIAHIGFGSGGTAHAVSLHTVDKINVIEINPSVLSSSDRFFGSINHGVLREPEVDVVLNDGRNFILATDQRFDAILSDSIHPRFSGNGSLYTKNYFELVAQRLKPGGVASMWLPTYSLTKRNYKMIVRAFSDVFPNTAVWYEPSSLNPFTIVTGRLDIQPWDVANVNRIFDDPQVKVEFEKLGLKGPAEVIGCYIIGGEELRNWLRNTPPHEDDYPAVEYESAIVMDRTGSWLANFDELLRVRQEDPPAAYLSELDPKERARSGTVYREFTRKMEEHRKILKARYREELRPPKSSAK